MKTTIYELLGMIKDDILIKRILYRNGVYEYDEDGKDFYNEENGWIFDEYDLISILNDPVEILETTITFKKEHTIEKVDEPYESCIFKTDYEFASELEKKIIDNIELIRKKQDEIIDILNGE